MGRQQCCLNSTHRTRKRMLRSAMTATAFMTMRHESGRAAGHAPQRLGHRHAHKRYHRPVPAGLAQLPCGSACLLQDDVDSTKGCSTPPTTPGCRTSMMATRTTTTRTTSTAPALSADSRSVINPFTHSRARSALRLEFRGIPPCQQQHLLNLNWPGRA